MSDNTYNTRLSKNLAKGDTPSVAMLRRLKARDELTIKNDSGDSDVFRPGDWWVQILCAVSTSCCFCWSSFSAFLAHQGVDRNSPLDGHDYWKAQILSIHTFNGRPWLRVRWFYSATLYIYYHKLTCKSPPTSITNNIIYEDLFARVNITDRGIASGSASHFSKPKSARYGNQFRIICVRPS